jgi:KUP system potassium uptake protein
MEEPSVPEVLRLCREQDLVLDLQQTTFFLSRETVIPRGEPTARRWRNRLFAVMSRNAQSATAFFRLPANRVVELGMQVDL